MNRPTWPAAACAVLGSLALLLGGARAAHAALNLELFPGYDKLCRSDSWTPLTVHIKGNGRQGAAELQVEVRERNSGGLRLYTAPVTLPDGAVDEVRQISFRNVGYDGDTVVRLVQNGNKLAEKKLDNAMTIDDEQVAVVALTQDRGGFGQLAPIALPFPARAAHNNYAPMPNAGVGGRKASTLVIYPAARELPTVPRAFEGIDMVVLGDISLDQLSDDQWLALRRWVIDGGVLVVSGGTDLNRLRAPQLADLLPIQPVAVRSAASLSPLAQRFGGSLQGTVPMVAGRLKPGAQALCSDSGGPILAEWRQGRGAVAFAAFDLTNPAVTGWRQRNDMWQRLVKQAPNEEGVCVSLERAVTNMQDVSATGALVDALAGVQSTNPPSFYFIGGFLALYILVLVPINYLVLKRLDRKELTWITAPIIIIVFSSGAYAIGYSAKGSALNFRQCTVLEGGPNSGDFHAFSVATIFSPRQTPYNVSVADPSAVAAEARGAYDGAGGDLRLQRTQETAIQDAVVNMWDHRTFAFDSHAALGSGIGADVKFAGGAYTVAVTNRTGTTIEDAQISLGTAHVSLGRLEAGQTARQRLDVSHGQVNGLNLVSSGGTGTEETLRNRMVDAINAMEGSARGTGSTPLLFTGWVRDAGASVRLEGQQPDSVGVNLLAVHLPRNGE